MIVSKEARVHLDTNTYSVPHGFVGRSVHLRADDTSVRILADGAVIAEHPRCWGRRQAIEDRAHIDALLERRPAGRAPRRRDRLAALSPECRVYLQEIARRRIDLESEIQKLGRLLQLYGPSDLAEGMKRALAARTFGVRYVRALIDQSRFARGLGEPPEPIVTGNTTADEIVVEPHSLETYDALFQAPEAPSPTEASTPDPGDG
jgi:hypothetical protein